MLLNIFSIFIGGGIGAVLRYMTSLLYLRVFAFNFPLATLSVNIVGSLLFGMLVGYVFEDGNIPENLKHALTVGLCGGFTTFSTFAFETFDMIKRGEYLISILYVLLSVFLSVLICYAGFYWAKNYAY